MKKQLFTSIACFALLVVMFLGSTIAWFTDTAENVNTMVAGKISIDQTEIFDNTTVLLPSMTVKKTVTVENTGNQPCYVRTLFAFEDSEDGKVLEMLERTCEEGVAITVPGVTDPTAQKIQFQVVTGTGEDQKTATFTVGYYVYNDALPAGESFVSLESVTLSEAAGNDWMEAIGEKYEIFVLSQAVQTTGMEGGAEVALNTAFAPVDSEHCATWFAYVLDRNDEYTPESLTATVADDSSVIVIAEATNP